MAGCVAPFSFVHLAILQVANMSGVLYNQYALAASQLNIQSVCPLSSCVSSLHCLPVLSGPLAKPSLERKNVETSLTRTLTLCIPQRFKAMETVGKHAPFLHQGAHIHIFRQFARLFALPSFLDAASQDEKWMYRMYFAISWILEYHHSSMSILNLNLRKSLDQGAHAKESAQFSFALEQPGLRSSS